MATLSIRRQLFWRPNRGDSPAHSAGEHHLSQTTCRSLDLSRLHQPFNGNIEVSRVVRECRDPKDDKFLEVALNGKADLIVTGGADLLALHPWRDIAILSLTKYLKT